MTAQDNKIKVLIVAPNASATFGGEAFLPLIYFAALRARGFPVRLITHARNREGLMARFPGAGDSIHFIPDSAWHRGIFHTGRRFPEPLRSAVFGTALNLVNEVYQTRLIRQLLRAGEVEVIHQPTPVSPKLPSSVHGFGVPVIIGPMNGGMTYPEGYEDHQSGLARRFIAVSRRIAVAMNWVIPGKRKAAALLVANQRTRAALPVRHPKVIDLVENAVDLGVWQAPAEARPLRQATDPFRLVFLGRLVGWKAVDVTLDALKQARSGGRDVRLDILGDGEARADLERRAAELGLGGAVRFLGFMPQADCAAHMRASDALILNSIFECGGAVVLEAMSLGLPVIASDWGGPADYLDDECGILIPPVPRADFAGRIAAAMIRLADDPDLGRRMGEAGRAKVIRHYDWQKKVDRVIDLYREVLSERR